jgi:hypothetical protein
MEDYFVIILTLIIAVVGAFNRKKKKGTATNPVEGTEKQSTDFWDLLVDEADEQPIEEPQEYTIPEPVVEQVEEPVKRQVYNFTAQEEGESSVEENPKVTKKKKRKKFVAGEEFSLKKAVIYNEILNRKYS